MNTAINYEQLTESVTRIARHAYYPGKEETLERCLEEIHDLESAGRITTEQQNALRELLLENESECMAEGLLRERQPFEPARQRDRIALYCEGVGSHAAFASGVLQGLLANRDDSLEIAALGGASWGAVCAMLAWDGLLRNDPIAASEQLGAYWRDYEVSSPFDTLLNYSSQMALHVRTMAAISGFRPNVEMLACPLPVGRLLARRIDFDRARALAGNPEAPGLVVATLNDKEGFRVVRGEEISLDDLVEAAGQPRLLSVFEPVGAGDGGPRPRTSPIRALLDHAPNELWVIQVNQEGRAAGMPAAASQDGREGIARLLLEKEIRFIQTINKFLQRGILLDSAYHHVEIHRIIMDHDFDEASTLDRSAAFLDDLTSYGKERVSRFLENRARMIPAVSRRIPTMIGR